MKCSGCNRNISPFLLLVGLNPNTLGCPDTGGTGVDTHTDFLPQQVFKASSSLGGRAAAHFLAPWDKQNPSSCCPFFQPCWYLPDPLGRCCPTLWSCRRRAGQAEHPSGRRLATSLHSKLLWPAFPLIPYLPSPQGCLHVISRESWMEINSALAACMSYQCLLHCDSTTRIVFHFSILWAKMLLRKQGSSILHYLVSPVPLL